MTHPANRRNGYRTRLVVYQGRKISLNLTVLRKPCARKVNLGEKADEWPFCPRRLAFMLAVAHRLQLSEVLDGANHLRGVAVLTQRAFGPLLTPFKLSKIKAFSE